MKAVRSSETSVIFCRPTRRHIPENSAVFLLRFLCIPRFNDINNWGYSSGVWIWFHQYHTKNLSGPIFLYLISIENTYFLGTAHNIIYVLLLPRWKDYRFTVSIFLPLNSPSYQSSDCTIHRIQSLWYVLKIFHVWAEIWRSYTNESQDYRPLGCDAV
jgi:hypothetical protein